MEQASTLRMTGVPTTPEQFNKAYNFPITFWGDTRVPKELKALITDRHPSTSLEYGCGLGRFSGYMAEQGVKATGVDFASVAIEKARQKVSGRSQKPKFIVGDVTNLAMLDEPFDVSFDVGCFHCLDEHGQEKYATEVHRLLEPGGTHLIWALDSSPADIKLSPEYIAEKFSFGFKLAASKFSRRRLIASHWYWLERE